MIEADLAESAWKEVIVSSDTRATPLTEDDIDVNRVEFSPYDAEKTKEIVSRSVAIRRAQPLFRKKLLSLYHEAYAVTTTQFSPVLEAALT